MESNDETDSKLEADPEYRALHQDCFRKVCMGQVCDPLFPAHPEPEEAPEDELTRAALEDPAAFQVHAPGPISGLWRLVALISLAVIALGIVFWSQR